MTATTRQITISDTPAESTATLDRPEMRYSQLLQNMDDDENPW